MRQTRKFSSLLLCGAISLSLLAGCGSVSAGSGSAQQTGSALPSAEKASDIQTGFIENQTLDDADETIHYSYYLPDNYDPAKTYPLIVTMPGYDRMWFGEDSAGSNIEWNGVQAWTKLSEPVILVSAQLTDWGETSARQANALTQYMILTISYSFKSQTMLISIAAAFTITTAAAALFLMTKPY